VRSPPDSGPASRRLEALAAAGAGPAAQHRAVSAVWAVSERSGASAAAVLDRVEEDLRIRLGQRREVDAQLAGRALDRGAARHPPASASGSGAAMGARPLAVLLGETRGSWPWSPVTLDAIGVLWTARIVAAAGETR
jgi:tight adherence protein B